MGDSFPSSEAGSLSNSIPLVGITEEPEALQTPTKAVSFGFQSFLGLANIALQLTIYPTIGILLPAQVAAIDPTRKVINLGLITTLGAIAAVIGNPIAGALSDRTTSRFGRRRPWMLVGTLVVAICLTLVANSSTILVLALAWACGQLFEGTIGASLGAIIPDRVPNRQRGTISAIVALSIPISIIVGAVLIPIILHITHQFLAAGYYMIIALLVVIMGTYIATYREKPLPAEVIPPFKLRSFLLNFWVSPRKYPDFGYAWITRFLVVLGYVVGTNYLQYYLKDVVHYEQLFPGQHATDAAANLQFIAGVFLIASTIVFGMLSDRLQRRKIFVTGSSVVIALGLLTIALFQTWPMAQVAAAVIGFGFGAYLAVDAALVTQVLPHPENRAKDLGVINIANASPLFLAPAFGALIISSLAFNLSLAYTMLFIVATALVLLGAVLVQPIKGVR